MTEIGGFPCRELSCFWGDGVVSSSIANAFQTVPIEQAGDFLGPVDR